MIFVIVKVTLWGGVANPFKTLLAVMSCHSKQKIRDIKNNLKGRGDLSLPPPPQGTSLTDRPTCLQFFPRNDLLK